MTGARGVLMVNCDTCGAGVEELCRDMRGRLDRPDRAVVQPHLSRRIRAKTIGRDSS